MDKLDHPEINTSELTAEVRRAMARQVLKRDALPIHPAAVEEPSHLINILDPEKSDSTHTNRTSSDMNFVSLDSQLSTLPKSPKLSPPPGFEPNGNDEYHLNDLLKFHDADFVNAAYRAILKREPDRLGYNECLGQLREGHLDKIDLLGSLRFSPEGKLKNVEIKGLALPTLARRLGRLPIIGYPILLGTGLLRLPSLIHRVRRHEAYSSALNWRLAEHANDVSEHVDTLSDAFERHLSNLSAVTTDLLSRSEAHQNHYGQMQQQLKALGEQQQQIATEIRQELGTEIDAQEQRQRLIQEQLSLLQASTNDTRTRVTQLESSSDNTHNRITQLESASDNTHNRVTQLESASDNTRNRITQLESSTQITLNRINQLESSTNDTRNQIAQLETSARAWIAQLESSVRADILAVDASTKDILTKLTETESATNELGTRLTTVESSAVELRSTNDKLESSTNMVQTEIEKVYQQLQHARTELALQGRRMELILEEARRRLPAPFDHQQLETIASEEQHKLDALYAELEDNFRGSHDEIKERFRTYLPYVRSTGIARELPIVDLGCGRGEWLELLKEEGYTALGVDSNRVLLDRCRARGLEVVETDALQYLLTQPDDSLGAITGFHIIEHLEISVLMKLLDEIVRVVHPGGLIIFETPNPENVLVGSNYFYFDPTHRNPLPSLLMKFLLESRGLHGIEVMNLHPWDQARLGGKNALTARFNDLFYGPMDYAIKGWKASG